MFRTSSVHHQERFVQAVFAGLVCGNTRTTRHVQPLRSNGWTCRVVRVLPHTKSANTAPDDGPVRSETCRVNICDEKKLNHKKLYVSCWTAQILYHNIFFLSPFSLQAEIMEFYVWCVWLLFQLHFQELILYSRMSVNGESRGHERKC